MYRPTGFTYDNRWGDLCTDKPDNLGSLEPKISGVTSAPVRSKVRLGL